MGVSTGGKLNVAMTNEFDRDERERRRHIRQWARFMITHLEKTEESSDLSFQEALVRLRELIDLELARVNTEG
jgi:hypothetical protein